MTELTERYTKIAKGFGARVAAVPDDAWDNPAPCEGWVARDVVRHLVDWVPAFFSSTYDVGPPRSVPSVDDDPKGAWRALDEWVAGLMADPDVVAREADTAMGRMTFDQAFDAFATGDVLVHTWDLARAAGLDESLDPDEVKRMYESMEPMDAAIRGEHFGPRVEVPEDSDYQTKLIAFTGRTP